MGGARASPPIGWLGANLRAVVRGLSAQLLRLSFVALTGSELMLLTQLSHILAIGLRLALVSAEPDASHIAWQYGAKTAGAKGQFRAAAGHHLQKSGNPPRGWNSYDSYTWFVNETQFLQNCKYLADHLLEYGYVQNGTDGIHVYRTTTIPVSSAQLDRAECVPFSNCWHARNQVRHLCHRLPVVSDLYHRRMASRRLLPATT